jgi:hypothetical protein
VAAAATRLRPLPGALDGLCSRFDRMSCGPEGLVGRVVPAVLRRPPSGPPASYLPPAAVLTPPLHPWPTCCPLLRSRRRPGSAPGSSRPPHRRSAAAQVGCAEAGWPSRPCVDWLSGVTSGPAPCGGTPAVPARPLAPGCVVWEGTGCCVGGGFYGVVRVGWVPECPALEAERQTSRSARGWLWPNRRPGRKGPRKEDVQSTLQSH